MDLRKRRNVERWRRESGGRPAGVKALLSARDGVRYPVGPRGWMMVGAGCLVAWLGLLQWSGSAMHGAAGDSCIASASTCAGLSPGSPDRSRASGASS